MSLVEIGSLSVIAIVALVYLVNAFLGVFPAVGGEAIILERMLGIVMAPLTMMMGIPFAEAFVTGQLMGTKVVLTEFVAYVRFGQMSPVNMGISQHCSFRLQFTLCSSPVIALLRLRFLRSRLVSSWLFVGWRANSA